MQTRYHRRSIRLPNYDYTQNGMYFITICTHNRECLFGDVVGGVMELNDVGSVVQMVWKSLPSRFSGIELDQFVVMPNHVHGIIGIVGAQFIAPKLWVGSFGQGAINRAPTLAEIVRTISRRAV